LLSSQIPNYIGGFIHPLDTSVFPFYAQAWYLAFSASSNQFGIVSWMKQNIFERNFETLPPKHQAYGYAKRAGTKIVQLVSLYLLPVSSQLKAPHCSCNITPRISGAVLLGLSAFDCNTQDAS